MQRLHFKSLDCHVWMAAEAELPTVAVALSPSSKARVETLLVPARRDLFVRSRWLLAHAVQHCRQSEFAQALADIVETPSGPRTAGLQLSLSHARGVVCALAEVDRIGVDMEWLEPTRDFERIAARIFSAAECSWIGSNAKRFFELWTIKEAAVKAGCVRRMSDAPSLIEKRVRQRPWPLESQIIDGFWVSVVKSAQKLPVCHPI
jgi:4'-phosphopantetheinyl transferase EntD